MDLERTSEKQRHNIGSRPQTTSARFTFEPNTQLDQTDLHPKLAVLSVFRYTYPANPAVEERCCQPCRLRWRSLVRGSTKDIGTPCPPVWQRRHNHLGHHAREQTALQRKKEDRDGRRDTHLSSTSTFAPSNTAFSNRLAREPRSSFATSTASLHTYRSPCSSGTLRLHVMSSPHKVGCVTGTPESKWSGSC